MVATPKRVASGQRDGDESAGSQVPLSVDEIGLKRNETPRET